MNGIENLLAVARAYAEIEGVPLTTVSFRVFDDSKKLAAIGGKADIGVRRFERAMQWFSDNWPNGDWPAEVPRPSLSVAEAAQ